MSHRQQGSRAAGPSSSARQQFSRDVKHQSGPSADDEDPLSSVPASPASMGTIDDEFDPQNRDVVDDSLPPPYTPTATVSTPTQSSMNYTEHPQAISDYGSIPPQSRGSAVPFQARQMTPEDVETSRLLPHQPSFQAPTTWRNQLYMRRRKRMSLCFACCKCCTSIFIVLLTVVSILLLVAWIIYSAVKPSSDSHTAPLVPDTPSGTRPHTTCPHSLLPSYNKTVSLEWTDPESTFTIKEQSFPSSPDSGAWFDVNLHLLPALPKQQAPIAIKQTVYSSSPDIVKEVHSRIGKSMYEFELSLPGSRLFGQNHCTYADVDVYIKPDAFAEFVDRLSVDMDHFSIELAAGLDLPLSNSLFLGTKYGSVIASEKSKVDAREVVIHVQFGTIKGVFPLRDVLDVSTTAGAIDFAYNPRPALESAPLTPANLVVKTEAGSIKAKPTFFDLDPLRPNAWPARRYITHLRSSSGSIENTHVPLGERLETDSNAGFGNIEVLPVVFPSLTRAAQQDNLIVYKEKDEWLSHVVTSSTAGKTVLSFQEPVRFSQDFIEVLNKTKSDHSSSAGAITLHYPETWTGNLEITTTTSSLWVSGDRIDVIKHEKGWVGQKLVATRSDSNGHLGGSDLNVGASHGPVLLIIGKE